MPVQAGSGSSHLGGTIFRCVLALIIFFALNGFGFITGAYALYYAFQNKDEEKGMLGLSLAGATMAIILVGWFIRMNNGPKSIVPISENAQIYSRMVDATR